MVFKTQGIKSTISTRTKGVKQLNVSKTQDTIIDFRSEQPLLHRPLSFGSRQRKWLNHTTDWCKEIWHWGCFDISDDLFRWTLRNREGQGSNCRCSVPWTCSAKLKMHPVSHFSSRFTRRFSLLPSGSQFKLDCSDRFKHSLFIFTGKNCLKLGGWWVYRGTNDGCWLVCATHSSAVCLWFNIVIIYCVFHWSTNCILLQLLGATAIDHCCFCSAAAGCLLINY